MKVLSGSASINKGKMKIQDDLSQDGIEPDQDMGSSDIRKIKLNYIQLNKRATTASGTNGRKIPQKVEQPMK